MEEDNKFIKKMRKLNANALWPTGFAAAIIGISTRQGVAKFIVSSEKSIQILIDEHDMTREDATDYYYYNIEGSHMGKNQPIYLTHPQ